MRKPATDSATQTTPENGVDGGINTVQLENGLGEIKANREEGHGGGSLAAVWTCTLPHPDTERGRYMHQMGRSARRYMTLETIAP